ncbi:MAG: hypothetical protein AAGG46_11005, partial [Planctomycetota bacterium]
AVHQGEQRLPVRLAGGPVTKHVGFACWGFLEHYSLVSAAWIDYRRFGRRRVDRRIGPKSIVQAADDQRVVGRPAMPVYLFTYHTYGSWLPDRPQGYVQRDQGI